MISYGVWKEVLKELKFPNNKVLNDYNKINRLYLKGLLPKNETICFLRFSDGDMKLQDKLDSEGYKLFPNPKFSKAIRNREEYMEFVDKHSKFPLIRKHYKSFDSINFDEISEIFGENKVVVKVGNLHASEGKYLIDFSKERLGVKYAWRKLPTTIEEYVPNARSIRVGFIGDFTNKENIFITEHINSKTWLKNNNPENEVTYSYKNRYDLGIENIDDLINEVLFFAKHYNANLMGVDFVVAPNKVGILELNDMIGLPYGELALRIFTNEVAKIV